MSLSRDEALAQAIAYVKKHCEHTHHEFQRAFINGWTMALISEEDRVAYREVVHGPDTDAPPTPATCFIMRAKP